MDHVTVLQFYRFLSDWMSEENVQHAGFSCAMSHFTATQFTRSHPKCSAAFRKLHLPSSIQARNHHRPSQPLVESEKNPERRRRGGGRVKNLARVLFFLTPTQKILIDFPAGFDFDLRCSACDVLACITSISPSLHSATHPCQKSNFGVRRARSHTCTHAHGHRRGLSNPEAQATDSAVPSSSCRSTV